MFLVIVVSEIFKLASQPQEHAIKWQWIIICFIQETLMSKRNEGRHFNLIISRRMQYAYGFHKTLPSAIKIIKAVRSTTKNGDLK
jgi:hypothetical protein